MYNIIDTAMPLFGFSFPDFHHFVSCFSLPLIYLLWVCPIIILSLYCRPLVAFLTCNDFLRTTMSYQSFLTWKWLIRFVFFFCLFNSTSYDYAAVRTMTLYHYACSYPPAKHYYWCYNNNIIMLHYIHWWHWIEIKSALLKSYYSVYIRLGN